MIKKRTSEEVESKKEDLPEIFSDVMEDIAEDAIVKLMPTPELYEKWKVKVSNPCSYRAFVVLLSRKGVAAHKKMVRKTVMVRVNKGKQRVKDKVRDAVTKEINRQAQSKAKADFVGALANRIVMNKVAGAKLHKERVFKVLNKMNTGLCSLPPSVLATPDGARTVEMFDKIGRRLFDMDDTKELNPTQFNIAVLLNTDKVPMSQSTEAMEADLQFEDADPLADE